MQQLPKLRRNRRFMPRLPFAPLCHNKTGSGLSSGHKPPKTLHRLPEADASARITRMLLLPKVFQFPAQ